MLIEYVAATAADHDVKNAIARKDKKSMPIPVRRPHPQRSEPSDVYSQFCCLRYRPTKVRVLGICARGDAHLR